LNRVYDYIRSKLGAELDGQWAHLDFEGLFFMLAFKEGSSEREHVDFNDSEKTITWVLAIGDWKGGEFCLPQLGKKIPMQSGQLIGAMTRILVHSAAPVEGRRLVFTCFTDKLSVKYAERWFNELNKNGYIVA
jgi:hypothetical protein